MKNKSSLANRSPGEYSSFNLIGREFLCVRNRCFTMSDALKNVFPAIIALVGTIIAVFVGYRQWKRQQDTTRTSDFQAERQKTYKELWEKLEDVHVRLRTMAVQTEEFRSLLRDVNSYILKHSLYLEKDDHRLANQYLAKVRDFTNLVASFSSAPAKIALEDTADIPPEVMKSVEEMAKAQKDVDQIREGIVARYRKVLTGEVIAPGPKDN
jgi:hypothetical protein